MIIPIYMLKIAYIGHYIMQVQEARQNHDDDAVKKAVNEYDEALER